jgi:hypothetical protein
MMAFNSPENMMKNLPKSMSNIFLMPWVNPVPLTDSPTFKISMREYEDTAIKAGDRMIVEIKKSDRSTGR